MAVSTPPSTLIIDQTTILSLLLTLLLLFLAYTLSHRLLPPTTPPRTRTLYIWHLFDALIHFLLEGSFLYNCFFTFLAHPSATPHPLTPPGVYFLAQPDRLYGSAYGNNPMAKLWQEYAKADRRWGGADLGVISLELLTVFGAGPLAVVVCEGVRRRGGMERWGWFWAVVLATGELYGGFMTFAPEWLTGCPNLDTSNFMYLWVYLFFFNMLWVVFPLWVLYEAYGAIQGAFARAGGAVDARVSKKKA